MAKKLNLYDMLKDHPRFPKTRKIKIPKYPLDKTPETLKAHTWGHNDCCGKFISFLKSVGVDADKVTKNI